jgi:hypothetical protein
VAIIGANFRKCLIDKSNRFQTENLLIVCIQKIFNSGKILIVARQNCLDFDLAEAIAKNAAQHRLICNKPSRVSSISDAAAIKNAACRKQHWRTGRVIGIGLRLGSNR